MNMGPPVSWSKSCRRATSIGARPLPPPVVRLLLRCGDRCCCGDIGLLPGEQSDRLSGMSFSVSGSTCAVRRMPIREWLMVVDGLPLPPFPDCESCNSAACAAAWFWCRFNMDLDLRCGSGERFIDSADTDGVDLPLFPAKTTANTTLYYTHDDIYCNILYIALIYTADYGVPEVRM